MIYQCYFKKEQEPRLFTKEPYRGFGLEPDVNPTLLNNCPELVDENTRLALVEYAAFLHIWRNLPFDNDDWIGFTSYRQTDKTNFIFKSKQQIEDAFLRHDLVAWHVLSVIGSRTHSLKGAAAQAEIYHPMLHEFTTSILGHFGIVIPKAYYFAQEVPYANYWAMSKTLFASFMTWSWPMVQYALTVDHAYKRNDKSSNPTDDKRKAVGYFMERLFIIWTMLKALRIVRFGRLRRA
ncbi:MAG: hypothetical protein ACYDC8_04270 [Gammaproteobacteria bacterium]